jgi:hypothetical protein
LGAAWTFEQPGRYWHGPDNMMQTYQKDLHFAEFKELPVFSSTDGESIGLEFKLDIFFTYSIIPEELVDLHKEFKFTYRAVVRPPWIHQTRGEREAADSEGGCGTRAGESQGDVKSSLGDAESSLGDATSSLGDAKSSLGDAKSSLGDAKSSLGDAISRPGGCSCTRWHQEPGGGVQIHRVLHESHHGGAGTETSRV